MLNTRCYLYNGDKPYNLAQVDNDLINDLYFENMIKYGKSIEKLKIINISLYLAVSYIYKNSNSELLISDVARQSNISSSHLSYLFRVKLNTKFKDVLFLIRINKANNVLSLNPNISLTKLAQDLGFYDLSHFGKVYKRYTGTTITNFKKESIQNLIY
ncbi:helix-turn-helix domain-containing protein [Photobacterium leiognathi]|uniref:helix-turn-helix domain-containing protein n=1 Tax=Photobacterium leiognathi TaxID=553611 RepID=UPI002981654C|nr:helix-turn-helix domain-containing protein [Photobacterium leiognathi]